MYDASPQNGSQFAAPGLDTSIETIGDLTLLSDRDLEQALADAEKLILQQAREYSLGGLLSFLTIVGRDESGRPLEPGVIHRSWFEHIFYCWSVGAVPVILAPWGHGKSVNIAVMLPLWMLGVNQDLREKIVSNSNDNAKKRVRAVRSLICDRKKDRSKHLGRVFPDLVRDRRGAWNDHAITVTRSPEAMAVDFSLEAHGIFGTGIGGRCDLLIFDDVTDRRNAIEHPSLRPRVISTVGGTWQSRLEPTGRQVAIMTRWHEADLAAHWMRETAYCVMVQSIDRKKNHVNVDVYNAPDNNHPVPDRLPLWSARWNKKALIRRQSEIGDREYARGFEQRAISDEELWFPNFPKSLRDGRIDSVEGISDARHVASWDPASKKRRGTGMIVLAVLESGLRVFVDVRLGQWPEPRAAQEMDHLNAMYDPDVVMVESNATQDSIEEWAKESEKSWWPKVKSFVTGRNKADPEYGLRSLDIEFSRSAWVLCMDEPIHPVTGQRCDESQGAIPLRNHITSCECPWCHLINQLKTYPGSADFDLGMCTWFSREGARCYIGGGDLALPASRGKRGMPIAATVTVSESPKGSNLRKSFAGRNRPQRTREF